MRLLPQPGGILRVRLDIDEAQLLDQLIGQLIELLQSHSRTALDPDPVLASLEVGGSSLPPDDPALARLFPNAYEDESDAAQYRSVTEQGLLNRKLQDAAEVTAALGIGLTEDDTEEAEHVEVMIARADLSHWVRTLASLRLAISARIGLKVESDHPQLLADAETRGTVLVYDWLGAILDSLLRIGTEAQATEESGPN